MVKDDDTKQQSDIRKLKRQWKIDKQQNARRRKRADQTPWPSIGPLEDAVSVLEAIGYSHEVPSEYGISDSLTATQGDYFFTVPAGLDGMEIVDVIAGVFAKGVTGTTAVQLIRTRAGVGADVLSTKITIADEWYARDGVIDTDYDDLETGDILRYDIEWIHTGTAPLGFSLVFTARPV